MRTIIVILIVLLFMGLACTSLKASIEIFNRDSKEKFNVLSEPYLEFNEAEITLDGKCLLSKASRGFSHRICNIPLLPLRDNVAFVFYFGHGILGRGEPGIRLELIEGKFIISSHEIPGIDFIINYDGNTYIEFATFIGATTWIPEDGHIYTHYYGRVKGVWAYE
jgi:hypothetical protein